MYLFDKIILNILKKCVQLVLRRAFSDLSAYCVEFGRNRPYKNDSVRRIKLKYLFCKNIDQRLINVFRQYVRQFFAVLFIAVNAARQKRIFGLDKSVYRSTVKVKNKIVRAVFLYIFKRPALPLSIAVIVFFRKKCRQRRNLSYRIISCELRASFNNLLHIVRTHSDKAGTLDKRRSIHSADIHRSSAVRLSCYHEKAQSVYRTYPYRCLFGSYKGLKSAVFTPEIYTVFYTVVTFFKTQYDCAVLIF